MNFFKKIFKPSSKLTEKEIKEQNVMLSLDDSFVHNFIKRGGKFLYSYKKEDITFNIQRILDENNWNKISYINTDLSHYISSVNVHKETDLNSPIPFFTNCESLIAESGSILFSECQLKDKKLAKFSNDFIVFATTSQIVKSKGDSLTGIKIKYKKNIPANISSIDSFNKPTDDDNFLNYGTTNSKNLYLLLLEDL